MKICWDMLEGVHLTRNGLFVKGTVTYIYKEVCAKCGEPYLLQKRRDSEFCSRSCARSGEGNSMYGKTHSIRARKKMSTANIGKVFTIEHRKKISRSNTNHVGVLSSFYKGGVTKMGLIAYDTQKDKLSPYEEVRKQEGTETLEVRCVYCGRWFAPKGYQVKNRLTAINNLNKGECRFYCSENCKQACPVYRQIKYPKGFKHTSSREVSTYLRKMVLERDNWTCQICGKTIKEVQLHVHHMDPATQNPMFQNDIDSCITLCKGCHGMVHKRRGCRYIDLRCNRETDYTRKFKEEIRLKSVDFQE